MNPSFFMTSFGKILFANVLLPIFIKADDSLVNMNDDLLGGKAISILFEGNKSFKAWTGADRSLSAEIRNAVSNLFW